MISREVLWLSCNLHVVFFIIIIIILPILKSNSNIKVCINRNKQNEKYLTVSLRILRFILVKKHKKYSLWEF